MRESSSVHQAYEHSAGSPDLPLQSRLQGGQFLASVYIATPLFKKKKITETQLCTRHPPQVPGMESHGAYILRAEYSREPSAVKERL